MYCQGQVKGQRHVRRVIRLWPDGSSATKLSLDASLWKEKTVSVRLILIVSTDPSQNEVSKWNDVWYLDLWNSWH